MRRGRVASLKYSPWSDDDVRAAAALFASCKAEGLTNAQTDLAIASELGKTISAVRRRREYYGVAFANGRRAARAYRYDSRVSQLALAERDRAMAAERSLTAELCGDPLPGRSALKRRDRKDA